jgi:hypothetical protein
MAENPVDLTTFVIRQHSIISSVTPDAARIARGVG